MTTQPALFFNVRVLTDHMREVASANATRIPQYLRNEVREAMLIELSTLALQTAEAETGPYRITQDYQFKNSFEPGSLFVSIASALSQQLNTACAGTSSPHLSTPLQFNDLVVQRYHTTNQGIGVHRDGARYHGLVALLVLEGEGEFFLCDDREGNNPRAIENRAGDLLLLRAPGFAGADIQPFHYVGKVPQSRTSFALRHDSRKK